MTGTGSLNPYTSALALAQRAIPPPMLKGLYKHTRKIIVAPFPPSGAVSSKYWIAPASDRDTSDAASATATQQVRLFTCDAPLKASRAFMGSIGRPGSIALKVATGT